MAEIGAYEAKTHLSQLLERVGRGERFTITRHGVPIAVLQPPDGAARADVDAAIDELLTFRRGRRLDGLSVRDLVEEGRR